MKTITNILDTFSTVKEYPFGPMRVIDKEILKKALMVSDVECTASGCRTIWDGNFNRGTFSEDEIKDMLTFIFGGTFGGNVQLIGSKFIVDSWSE